MSNLIAHTGLIHGAGFTLHEGQPQLSDGSRLNAEHAALLISRGRIESAICSGRGPLDYDYKTSEAQLMADHLLALGVDHTKIKIEDQSTSAVGNWALSAPLITESDDRTVLGITAHENVKRMKRIGDFVAERSDFFLIGYSFTLPNVSIKNFIRERVVDEITKRFLETHKDTPVPELEAAYDIYKARFGVSAIKRFAHRGTTI